jgi:hypothetical protein
VCSRRPGWWHALAPARRRLRREAEQGDAELQAHLTAGSALLADYQRWTGGETIIGATAESHGADDWATWADRLAQHLGWVIEAASR